MRHNARQAIWAIVCPAGMCLTAAACLLAALPRAAEAQLRLDSVPGLLRDAARVLERQLHRRLGRVSKRVQCRDQIAGQSSRRVAAGSTRSAI